MQKQDYVDYLLDVLHSPDMEERAAFIIDCGKEVSNLERRMAELAAGDTAGRRTDHARSTDTPDPAQWLYHDGNPHYRLLEDAYLLPQALTSGKTCLEISIRPLRERWNKCRYRVYALTPEGTDD